MLHSRSGLGLNSPVGDRNVFIEDLLVGIESISLLGSLREGLVLKHRIVVLSLLLCELSRSVIIVFHVWHCSTKSHLQTKLTLLYRISLDVSWHRNDFSWILLTSEIFLNVSIVRHVLI